MAYPYRGLLHSSRKELNLILCTDWKLFSIYYGAGEKGNCRRKSTVRYHLYKNVCVYLCKCRGKVLVTRSATVFLEGNLLI